MAESVQCGVGVAESVHPVVREVEYHFPGERLKNEERPPVSEASECADVDVVCDAVVIFVEVPPNNRRV